MKTDLLYNGQVIQMAHRDGVSEEIIAALAENTNALILIPHRRRIYLVGERRKGEAFLTWWDCKTPAAYTEETARYIKHCAKRPGECRVICKI